MTDPIKITNEEHQSAADLRVKYENVIYEFGKIYVEKINVENAIKAITERENKLQEQWLSLQNKENDLVQELLKKYGEGSIDLKQGLFIPSK